MRRMKTCVLAAALLGMCAGSAYAQEMVVARVPFPFAVRGQQFAAGRYSISTEEGVVTIRGINTQRRSRCIDGADGWTRSDRRPAGAGVRPL